MTIKQHGKGKVSSAFSTGCLSVSCLCSLYRYRYFRHLVSGRDSAWTPSRALGQLRQLPQNLGNETCWERRHAQYGSFAGAARSRVRQCWQMQAGSSVAVQFDTLLSFSNPHSFFLLIAELPLCMCCSMEAPQGPS